MPKSFNFRKDKVFDSRKIYNHPVWKKLSKRLRRERIWCEVCLKKGVHTLGVECHHMVPLEEHGGYLYAFNPDKIQVICRKCHREIDGKMPKY